MPLPSFLALIAVVIVAAGLSIAVVHLAGISVIWLGLVALVTSLAVRALRWN